MRMHGQSHLLFSEMCYYSFMLAYYFLSATVIILLTCVAVIDAVTQEIPNALNLALLLCGFLAFFIAPQIDPTSRLIGLVCVSVPMLVITHVFPGAFGMGDVKLMGACGLILGWKYILVAAIIGILIGGVQGIFLLTTRKKTRKEHFAFGPALCIGVTSALFFGGPLFDGYLALF